MQMLRAADFGRESLVAYPRIFDGDRFINAPEAFNALFSLEYWNRLWIVQEVTLAREVIIQCGTETIEWDYLDSLVTYMDSIGPWDDQSVPPTKPKPSPKPLDLTWIRANLLSPPAHLVRLRRSTETMIANDFDDPGHCLLNLCCVRGQAYCVDPRDKIFGLHALAQKCCADAVPVDYSLSLFQVSTKVLSHHAFSHSNPGKIVSESYKFHDILRYDLDLNEMSTVLAASVSLKKRCDGPLFRVHCIGSSRVSCVYPLSQEEITRDQQLELSLDVWPRLLLVSRLLQVESPSTNLLRITRQVDLVCTIGVDISYYPHSIRKEDGLSGDATSTTLLNILSNPPESTTYIPKSDTQCNDEDNFKKFRGLLAGLREVVLPHSGLTATLAFNENGIIILAPSNITVGDILCRFESADDTLAILRPCQEAKNKCYLVGRAVTLRRTPNSYFGALGLAELEIDVRILQLLTLNSKRPYPLLNLPSLL
ncbi:hypothetical protein V8E51_011687 [Hyaloscypha variabilis]